MKMHKVQSKLLYKKVFVHSHCLTTDPDDSEPFKPEGCEVPQREEETEASQK